jgi:hypothetical protein
MIFGMWPWSAELAGRVDDHVISSELLRGNPLGDPYERPLLVYTPPGHDDDLIRFELFDATHAGIDYRYPLSLAWLCERIADLPGTRPLALSRCSPAAPGSHSSVFSKWTVVP